jgi:murein DD-endopeptidase MepM/ murein hydrolase activator NlpD
VRTPVSRRHFLRFTGTAGLCVAAGLAAPLRSARSGNLEADRTAIDLSRRSARSADAGRSRPSYLHGNDYAQHVNRPQMEYNLGGVDYAPASGPAGETEVCPVAAGAVTGAVDDEPMGGMYLTIAHGLGWKTEYNHLRARYVGHPDTLVRREVIGIMGRSGRGATRPGFVEVHLHLSLFGPVYSPLFRGVAVQVERRRPNWIPRWGYVLDPEEFSLAGAPARLPYSREADAQADEAFLAKHADAVEFCDGLLDRMGDAEAAAAKQREAWEVRCAFDGHVDERIWYLWQRFRSGRHPFSPGQVSEHRATLLDFMGTVPRLTAPIVESAQRQTYRLPHPAPLKVYAQS